MCEGALRPFEATLSFEPRESGSCRESEFGTQEWTSVTLIGSFCQAQSHFHAIGRLHFTLPREYRAYVYPLTLSMSSRGA